MLQAFVRCDAHMPSQVRSLEREVELHQNIDHPNSVTLHEALQSTTEVFLVMGIAGECDLVDFVVHNGRLRESQAMDIAIQLLEFLVYLHHNKYAVHRDLKPDNVMLTCNADGSIDAKVPRCSARWFVSGGSLRD